MKKVLLVSALAFVPVFSLAGKATAQEARYGTEVCVNASLADESKRLFPNASLHVVSDSTDPELNGWRIVSGYAGADGRIHTDAQEIEKRRHERLHDRGNQ